MPYFECHSVKGIVSPVAANVANSDLLAIWLHCPFKLCVYLRSEGSLREAMVLKNLQMFMNSCTKDNKDVNISGEWVVGFSRVPNDIAIHVT